MASVKKQQYTKPIPEGAQRTTMKVRRRGVSVEVPAVRFRASDGRMATFPVVESGRTAGKAYRAASAAYYGRVKGKPVKLCADKAASEAMLADLVRQDARGEARLVNPFSGAGQKPLAEHLADFGRQLALDGASAYHVSQVAGKLRRCLLEGCGWTRLAQLDAGKVGEWLMAQRRDAEPPDVPAGVASFTVTEAAAILGVGRVALAKRVRQQRLAPTVAGKRTDLPRDLVVSLAARQSRGMGEQTARHYAVTLRSFGSWLVTPGKRLASNPLADLSPVTVAETRHARRELSSAELRLLLTAAAASGAAFRGLDGPARSLLYATACGTGYRVGGLAALTPECFDLSADPPTVRLPARSDKSKRGLRNPIPADLAESLRPFLEAKTPGVPVWPGSWAGSGDAAEMLRRDLGAAGIPYVVEGPEGPEHADFHALRHSYLTALGRAGVDLRVQQELAGHKSSKTTERYSHVRLRDLARAVDRLSPVAPGRILEKKSGDGGAG